MTELMTFLIDGANHIGLLTRVTAEFTKRHINIETLSVSPSSRPGIHRFIVTAKTEPKTAERIALRLERQVDVFSARSCKTYEGDRRDLGLYRLPSSAAQHPEFYDLLHLNNARLIERDSETLLLEKTGSEREIRLFLAELAEWGVLDFAQSGPVTLPQAPASANRGAFAPAGHA